MKTVHVQQIITVSLGLILALVAHRSVTLANDFADDGTGDIESATLARAKELTVEEEALANDARAHIAQAIENNLVRLFAVIAAGNDRRARQDEDTDIDVDDALAAVTPNPNVLPQVAQILGAIFSGSLNITRVVDQTFGLVPNLVRNQVGGLVKLLTGESMDASTVTSNEATTLPNAPASQVIVTAPASASPDAPAPVVASSAPAPSKSPAPSSSDPTTTSGPPVVDANKVPVFVESGDDEEVVIAPNSATAPGASEQTTQKTSAADEPTSEKIRYKVRTRTRASTTQKTPSKTIVEDDEIERLEEEIRRAAREYAPHARDREPRYFTNAFRQIFSRVDFNMTEIARAVPSIFKGARQAFTVLENLGILDVNEVLDELDLPTLEEEEEE